MIDKLIDLFKEQKEVEAILLGGSRASGSFDLNSDYDFYVYLNDDLSEETRKRILTPFVSYMEFSNRFWELEDDGILLNGIEVEFIYRNVIDIDKSLENLTVRTNVSHGYSTCYLDNLLNSKILFDKNGILKELKSKYSNSYSNELKDAIINYNYPILYDKMPSLYYQIEKAIKRNDLHSINHRVTAYFEMYYDVLFALNKKTHPGEKRLIELAKTLPILPLHFEEDILEFFSHMFNNNLALLESLKNISVHLYELLKSEGYYVGINSYVKKQD